MVVNFNFKINEKEYNLEVKECKSIYSQTLGLMFKKNSLPLLFIFKNPQRISIHSFFCIPFIAIWFLEDKIIDIKLVNPNSFTIKPNYKFNKLIEIPSNSKFFRILSTEANI